MYSDPVPNAFVVWHDRQSVIDQRDREVQAYTQSQTREPVNTADTAALTEPGNDLPSIGQIRSLQSTLSRVEMHMQQQAEFQQRQNEQIQLLQSTISQLGGYIQQEYNENLTRRNETTLQFLEMFDHLHRRLDYIQPIAVRSHSNQSQGSPPLYNQFIVRSHLHTNGKTLDPTLTLLDSEFRGLDQSQNSWTSDAFVPPTNSPGLFSTGETGDEESSMDSSMDSNMDSS